MHEEESIYEGGGNVFADLDLPEPEEALAKAELARRIGGIIKRQRLSQVQAAALLSLDQPKVSALLRGKLSGFSTDAMHSVFIDRSGMDLFLHGSGGVFRGGLHIDLHR